MGVAWGWGTDKRPRGCHKETQVGNSLEVRWLRLHAFTDKGVGSIPGRGTGILQAMCRRKKKEKRKLAGARSASRASGSLWLHGRMLEVGRDNTGWVESLLGPILTGPHYFLAVWPLASCLPLCSCFTFCNRGN